LGLKYDCSRYLLLTCLISCELGDYTVKTVHVLGISCSDLDSRVRITCSSFLAYSRILALFPDHDMAVHLVSDDSGCPA
jgi:hypothetical protein